MIPPIEARIAKGHGVADRQFDPEVAIRTTGFQEKHPKAARCSQPISQHTASRTGPDNDVVEKQR